MRLPASSSSAAGLQERIWDLHDNLSHAILSLSASAHRCCRRRAPEGRVVVKGWRRQGGCGDCGLEQEAAAAATMADARSLHAVRAALEDLEGHLHFLHNIQLRQVAERDAAIARLQQSRILLATRLAEHRWKKHEVIEEALAFVDDALDKSRFVSPEDVRGTHTHSQSVENQCPKIHDSNFLGLVDVHIHHRLRHYTKMTP
uniref:GTD-binding domain-containing protein n=1 Tax=Oryza rufipogon TaxID=4529 RepID=A0A0E0PYE6_ORYRU